MTTQEEKQKQATELAEKVDMIIQCESWEKTEKLMTPDELFNFLKTYYLQENLNYDDEVSKRVEEASEILEKELTSKPKPPYTPALLESIISLCKMGIMEELVVKANETNLFLRTKLEKLDIMNSQCGVFYQVAINDIFKLYMELMAKELKNECKSRGLEEEAFMKQCFGLVTTDMSLPFEIDSFAGLKNFEKVKDEVVSKETVVAFSNQTIEYSKLLIEGKVDPQLIAVFPSLMNQFLYFKFKIDSYQVLSKIIQILQSEDKEANRLFFTQLLKEIWHVETGRAIIMMVFQQQMEMMEQMMQGGMDPSRMGGMDPSGMGSMDPAMMQEMMKGMDPAMMEQMMGGMDPAMMQQMMGGMDPAMMQQMMGGMDPSMMQKGMGGMDPAMMQQMMGGMDPSMMQKGMGGMDPAMMQQMMGGMDPAMMQQMMSSVTPEMIQHAMQNLNPAMMQQMMGGMGGMDPAMMQQMMSSVKPENIQEALKKMNPEDLMKMNPSQLQKEEVHNSKQQMDEESVKAMMMGMNLAQSLPKPNLDEKTRLELQDALQKGDVEKMMSLMPPEFKELMTKLPGYEQPKKE